MRLLVAESESPSEREERRKTAGRSSGEAYVDTLKEIVPAASCDLVRPAEDGAAPPGHMALESYDGILLTGSPLHVYDDTPEVRRQIEFMRDVFASGTPSFGSCAGLQVAVAAAGGTVGKNPRGHEVAFARRITPNAAGRMHPFLAGRPASYDALALHSDQVVQLPEAATHLATNGLTAIQAAEVRQGPGTFWGVQYHPELPLSDIAAAVRRQSSTLVEQGLVRDAAEAERYASLIDSLHDEPERPDLAWQLGVDRQVTNSAIRQMELRNFMRYLVEPMRSNRGRA